MARYTGPKCRLCRREGGKLFLKGEKCFTDKCAFEKRAYAPGQHGQKRPRMTDYANQLREKQKLRRVYGILEKQFRSYYREAARRKGSTGEILLQILESRLDNVVYRMGFASSRNEARQIIRHHSIAVNGQRINIPAYQLKPKDVVAVLDKSKAQLRIIGAVEANKQRGVSEWLEVDSKQLQGIFKSLPDRDDLPPDINEHLVVELYSK